MVRKSKNRVVSIRADELKVHPDAQRKLVPSQIRKIASELDLDALGTFAIVERGAELLVVDGQHRLVALMQHGLGEWMVRCEIHVDAKDNDQRASELFLRLNTRAIVGPFDKFVNELSAEYPVALRVKMLAEKHGFKVDRVCANGHIACVTALKKLASRDDGEALDETLAIIVDAFGHTANAVEGKLVEGLGAVVSRFNGDLDRKSLVKKLAAYPGGAAGLLGSAKGRRSFQRSNSLAYCVAETVLDSYNVGRREDNRLEL